MGYPRRLSGTDQALMYPTVAKRRSLLDFVSVPAQRAFWMQRIRADYAGPCLKIQRASDSATQDIGFGADGFVNEAAMVTFCGASDGFLHTFYDQSPNASNFVATSYLGVGLFRIYVGSTQLLNRRNGKPCFLCVSGGGVAERAPVSSTFHAGLTGNAAFTLAYKYARSGGSTTPWPIGLGGPSGGVSFNVWSATQQIQFAINGAFNTFTTPIGYNTWQGGIMIHPSGAGVGTLRYRQEGVELTSSGTTGSSTLNLVSPAPMSWFVYQVGQAACTGTMAPGMLLFASVLSATDIALVEAFLATYT